MRNFKKDFVEECSSGGHTERTFKNLVERKNRSLSILSHLNTILNLPNFFEGFGKVLIFFSVGVLEQVPRRIGAEFTRIGG